MNNSNLKTTPQKTGGISDLRLLSIPEACKLLGIGSWAIYQQINQKALKTVKIGGRRLVSIQALNEFIKKMEE